MIVYAWRIFTHNAKIAPHLKYIYITIIQTSWHSNGTLMALKWDCVMRIAMMFRRPSLSSFECVMRRTASAGTLLHTH